MKRLLYLLTLMALLVGCAGPAPISADLEPIATREAVIDTSAPTGEVLMKSVDANPKRGGILKTAWGANPTHFDIHQGGGCAGCSMMYDGLVMWNLMDSDYVPQAYYSLGWTLFEQKKYKEAGEIFKKLIDKYPGHQLTEDASFKLAECSSPHVEK